jgi:outer membrane immunogenic protein
MTKLPGGMARVALRQSATLVGAALVGATLGMTGAAVAADLEVTPVTTYKAPAPVMRIYNWTGFYIGGNAGGHWGSDKITTVTDTGWVDGAGAAGGPAIDVASPITLNPKGFIGGLQAGYNLQGTGGGVFGIEVDVNWLGGTASRTLTNIPVIDPRDVMTDTVQASFLSTFRMRAGSTLFSDRALFFVTGGFALENLKTTDSMGHFGNTVITSTSNNTTQPGVVAGAGLEYAFTDFVSVKAEYLYVYVKHIETTIPATPGNADGITVTHAFSDSIFRAGLNFKVSSWSP